MGTSYETDIVAWANEQAALLRSGKLSAIDALQIAEEIEDVGKSEKRELASRMVLLLAHLMKWQFQCERRGNSWRRTIRSQRNGIVDLLGDSPSLARTLYNEKWIDQVWDDAASLAGRETELDFPEVCIWTVEEILDPGFFPDPE